MAKGFEIDWKGIDGMTAAFDSANINAKKQALAVIKNNTELVKKEAQRKAPRDTGFLHDNIVSRYDGMTGIIHSQASYSGYLEFGTRFMSAQPYMKPALFDVYPRFQRDMTDVFEGAFK
jgi:HK97 gp10 family phage protein